MDVTFEDVAMVIQDARYQQAISDVDTAQPDRQIKAPRNLNTTQFLQDNNITLKTMVTEPLGRWFLEKYADVEELNDDRMKRDVLGKEHDFLKCMEEVYDFRKRDPSSLIQIPELLRIIEKYGMESEFDQAIANGKC